MLKFIFLSALLSVCSLKAQEPHEFHNTERVQWFQKQLREKQNFQERPFLLFSLGREYIFTGKNDEAIKTFEEVKKIYNPKAKHEVDYVVWTFEDLLTFYTGLAYFRIGELENCVGMNNDHTCIFPITGTGVHMRRAGSENAIKYFMELLKRNPQHANSRWLLNLGHNTLGTYPDSVPAPYLLKPSLLDSEAPAERWLDKAPFMGIRYTSLAGGTVVDDFNNDGKLDIFYSSVSKDQPYKIYLGTNAAKMKDISNHSKKGGIQPSLDIFSADYNNDGNLDIFLSRGAWKGSAGELPGILLKGKGDGTFVDVTRSSLIKTRGPSQAISWGDYNNDGHLDLFVAYESYEQNSYPTQLWKNNGDGTFTNVAGAAGVESLRGFFKAAVWGDYDNDGQLDLILSNYKGQPHLLKNEAGKFKDVTASAGISGPSHTFPTWFFDYNNDGWEDLFLAGYEASIEDILKDFEKKPNKGEKLFLFENNRNGTFTNVAAKVNLQKIVPAMGANFGDINNDGYLDFYCGTGTPPLDYIIPNRMFLNQGGKIFKDITTATGTGHIQKGHGVAFADINNDGAQDLIINQGGFYEADFFKKYVFINPGTNNNWIRVKLVGRKTNRSAMGARLKISVMENGKERFIYRTVNTGGSFGANPLEQHIGIGSAKTVKQVQVYWPVTKKYQTVDNIAANKRIRIVEL